MASKRGFAAMDPEKRREIASKGGKASHGGGRKPKAKSKDEAWVS
jgi:general stress protein YciG